MKLKSLGAWAVAGVALWFSMGVLDVTGGPAGPVRVAMLPGFGQLAAAVALAVLAGAVAQRRMSANRRRDVWLPFYSLAVLALPYLPWLPDVLPVLRVFAGPGRFVVWSIVCAQVVWSAMGTGRGPRLVVRIRAWSAGRAFVAGWLVSAAIVGAGALRLAPTTLYPGGDEPHYLILAQSIWYDHDLKIENNHARRDQAPYFDSAPLAPHSLARGVDGAMYSVHPVGLPLLIAPVMGLAGYPGVVVFLLAMGAAASALAWVWLRRLTGSVSAATFGWAATALSVPFVCGSGLVYPEVPAALLVMLALSVGLRDGGLASDGAGAPRPASVIWRMALLGVTTGSLLWLSSKYAPMSLTLLIIGLWRVAADRAHPSSRRVRAIVAAVVPFGASLAAWFSFFYVIWGSPWPSAAYGGAEQTQMALSNLVRGVPGTLFDQEYGLLSYTPALAIAAFGFWSLWRTGGRARRLGFELGLVVGVLLLTVAGHAMWWGGSSVPGRFMLAGLLALGLPVAWEFRRAATLPDRRAVYRLLLLVGLSTSALALLVPDGSLLANRRDGISRLLEWLSPDWHLWAFAPDFVMQEVRGGLVQVGMALAAVAAAFWLFQVVLGRTRGVAVSRVGRGAAFLRANLAALAAALIVTALMPPVLGTQLKPDVAPDNRARVTLLDSFDPDARPVGLLYNPFSRVAAPDVPGTFSLSARPGSRQARQPAPVLLNARFALPAGRYHVELQALPGQPLAAGIALQGGTAGSWCSLTQWSVEAGPGETWTGTFDLPVDLSFVGFRSSGGQPAALGELRVRPAQVVPTLNRTAAYDTLAAAGANDSLVFLFHDGAAYPEGRGFWVRGSAKAMVSVVARTGRLTQPVRFRLRNGPVPNTIHIATPDGEQRIDFEPLAIHEVTISPTPLDGTLRMIFRSDRGFIPADTEPGNPDRRLLAVWVDVVE